MKKFKQIPHFKNENDERKFWATHDSTGYIDWSRAKKVKFSNLKPSTQSISIRLPTSLLERIKTEANKNDVPYQSYMKVLLSQNLENYYRLQKNPI